jgi:hypothetical protein
MRLSKDTYFYAGADLLVLPAQCRVAKPSGRVPIGIFAELKIIAATSPR